MQIEITENEIVAINMARNVLLTSGSDHAEACCFYLNQLIEKIKTEGKTND
jgi:hypothetical protein